MTYNELIKEITDRLEAHPQIRTVKNNPPKEWLLKDSQPEFPVCCFTINSGNINSGLEQVYNVQFFFLDKAGDEGLFEREVISDQLQICEDIILTMKSTKRDYFLDDSIQFNTIVDKYEDYLAGVETTFNITTQRSYDACDAP